MEKSTTEKTWLSLQPLDVAGASRSIRESKLQLVRVLLVACYALECKLVCTLLLLRVGAVVVRVMPCARADAGHTCLHLGHDLQASGIRGDGDLAAGMDNGGRARTAVGHHSRGKGKSRDDLARHGHKRRQTKLYFRDTGLLWPGACSDSREVSHQALLFRLLRQQCSLAKALLPSCFRNPKTYAMICVCCILLAMLRSALLF